MNIVPSFVVNSRLRSRSLGSGSFAASGAPGSPRGRWWWGNGSVDALNAGAKRRPNSALALSPRGRAVRHRHRLILASFAQSSRTSTSQRSSTPAQTNRQSTTNSTIKPSTSPATISSVNERRGIAASTGPQQVSGATGGFTCSAGVPAGKMRLGPKAGPGPTTPPYTTPHRSQLAQIVIE